METETAAHTQADKTITVLRVLDDAFKVSVSELDQVSLITFARDADAVDS